VAFHFPRVLQDALGTPNPVDLYRQILGGAQNNSITVVSIGFFDNLAGLLDSKPTVHSNLTGKELIATKVEDLVIMGGDYPRYLHVVPHPGTEARAESNSSTSDRTERTRHGTG